MISATTTIKSPLVGGGDVNLTWHRTLCAEEVGALMPEIERLQLDATPEIPVYIQLRGELFEQAKEALKRYI